MGIILPFGFFLVSISFQSGRQAQRKGETDYEAGRGRGTQRHIGRGWRRGRGERLNPCHVPLLCAAASKYPAPLQCHERWLPYAGAPRQAELFSAFTCFCLEGCFFFLFCSFHTSTYLPLFVFSFWGKLESGKCKTGL